jgi:hypothetical protein
MKTQKKAKPFSDETIDKLLKPGQTADDINGLLKQFPRRSWNGLCRAN